VIPCAIIGTPPAIDISKHTAGEDAMTTTSLENELLQLETQYWRALKDRDVNGAIRLTDFPCIISGPQGIGCVDQSTFAALMKNPAYTINAVELGEDAQVRFVRDDVAVLAYRVHEELTVDDKPVTVDANDSSTWIRRNERWLCAQHSEAIAGDPFGRNPTASKSDERAIRDLVKTWLDASRAGDLAKVMTLMTDDVVFMVPGRAPFGREEFAADSGRMKDVKLEAKSEVKEVEVIGDRAWCRTYLDLTFTRPGGESTRHAGYTLTILRKMANGAWAIWRDANLVTKE
jgi:uncharacterized protein (TIGR02246 family)